jgi:hypothetical protein
LVQPDRRECGQDGPPPSGPAARNHGRIATARAAAIKVVKGTGATVYVSSRPDMPGVLLFSRVPLSGRQGKDKKKDH